MPLPSVLDFMNTPDDVDEVFGEHYVKPAQDFKHGEWQLVARVEKYPTDGDGQPVEIDEARLPARFYRVRALASADSGGATKPAWSMSTGSGDAMKKLAIAIALAAAEGMISPDTEVERG